MVIFKVRVGLLCHLCNANLLMVYCSESVCLVSKAILLVTFKHMYHFLLICVWVKRCTNSDRALLCMLQKKMEISAKCDSVMEKL